MASSPHRRSPAESRIQLTPARVRRFLFGILLVLLALDLVSVYLRFGLQGDNWSIKHFGVYFDFNRERNLPTLFSTLLLLAAAGLLFRLGRQARGAFQYQRKYWYLLAGVFLFLTLDEGFQIHEQLSGRTQLVTGLENKGFLRYTWVLPYVAGLAVGALVLFNFLLALPRRIRTLFLLSGAIFVSGAVGLELFEGYVDTHYGDGNIYTALLCTLEELMEMTGVILFIYALLTHLLGVRRELRLNVRLLEEAEVFA
jgi:hypothetical protein